MFVSDAHKIAMLAKEVEWINALYVVQDMHFIKEMIQFNAFPVPSTMLLLVRLFLVDEF